MQNYKNNHKITLLILLGLTVTMPTLATSNHDIVFNQQEMNYWRSLNDGVMGGISKGRLIFDNNQAIFSGFVSTEYNGGFSSVVRNSVTIPSSTKHVILDLKGDGKEYQFRFIQYIRGYRVAYKKAFSTIADQQQTIVLPLTEFIASYRGRTIANAPELQPENVSEISYMASFKQPTQFELSLIKITFN